MQNIIIRLIVFLPCELKANLTNCNCTFALLYKLMYVHA